MPHILLKPAIINMRTHTHTPAHWKFSWKCEKWQDTLSSMFCKKWTMDWSYYSENLDDKMRKRTKTLENASTVL
jgi:hypothetical protein